MKNNVIQEVKVSLSPALGGPINPRQAVTGVRAIIGT